MGEDENQSLKTHAKKKKTKKEQHSHKKTRRSQKWDYWQFKCFTCDEKGHIAIYCPKKKGKKMRYHVHSIEDDEPVKKSAREDSSSDEENVLILALTDTLHMEEIFGL